jgi:hypothetical protein
VELKGDLDLVESSATGDARGMVEALKRYASEPGLLAWFFEQEIKPNGVESFMRRYEMDSDADYEELRGLIYGLAVRIDSLPGKILVSELKAGKEMIYQPIEWQEVDDPILETSPHYPTGCEAVDEILSGMGGVGVTVLAGQPKVGKSLMAVSTAVESARAGWRVVYVNAEMSRAHIGLRLLNYMGKLDQRVVDQMKIANVTTGITLDGLFKEVEKEVEVNDGKLLIVLDSINRIVDMGQTEGGENAYWRLLRDWSAWAMNSRRATEGRIGWLIVSELAAQGHVKGRSLEYLSDVVIRINATDVEDVVDVDVPYSRSTRSGNAGALFRDFARGTFIKGV